MNEQTNDLTDSCINKFHELANLFKELKRWLDKYRVTAGWYQETGKKCRYSYDGIGFIRL